jgi:hypothetical protein
MMGQPGMMGQPAGMGMEGGMGAATPGMGGATATPQTTKAHIDLTLRIALKQ